MNQEFISALNILGDVLIGEVIAISFLVSIRLGSFLIRGKW